ncbi:hypothetical protein [Cryptosporangium sp. NPDC048952]|uniref:hypothetical protein n=1 Tax=Cryptosporangium sp. NPDC048952 TaxID=3363961 RepID=UPI0037195EAB
MVPWLFVAGRAAPLDALPEAGVAAPGVAPAGVALPPAAEAVAAGLAEAGVAFAADGLVGAADFAGVEDAPAAGAGLAPAPAAGLVVADESGVPGFGGCLGAAAAGLVDDADDAPVPALRVVVSRDGVAEPPTVARPTVALPTAADARAELLEF